MALLEERKAKILIETGTARYGLKNTKSDGASTIVFGTWAKQNDAFLYSVDIDCNSLDNASEEIEKLKLNEQVNFIERDSVEFLKSFNQKVDFLYLDSLDYDKRDKSIQLKSQEHHLVELKAIEPQLHSDSLVLIDDHKLPGGGKGKLVVEHMIQTGWKIVMEEYQVLLSQQ